ncbi:MAG: DNA mismatch repair endonuclease MutL [Nitrospinae bacterium]|nr:DNA mismatch repair endonuclease MutL [Nitrospinota bacterium]
MEEYPKIKILPDELSNQIAAGEVVERPASVVKELVENAMDAGATALEIEVSLQKRRIRVRDDGVGVAPDEVSLALSRHGTSKIKDLDGIFGISTYGFRGEALPSIASVSRLTLSSYRAGEKAGRRIVVEGGKTIRTEDSPPLKGTEVLVENLFYNTPARRKFIRSEITEMGHITSRVVQSALSAPGTRFTYTKDGKRVMELAPAKNLLERVRQIFGTEYSDNLMEVSYSEFNIKVSGLVGKPHFHRATAIDQYFFVNRRPVRDMLIRSAVSRAFDDLVPRGRRPVVFLGVEIPFSAVDVNAHPAKMEVRLADPSKVSDAIVKGIRGAFGKTASTSDSGHWSGARQNPSDFQSGLAQGADTGGQGAENRPFQPYPVGGGPSVESGGFARAFELWRPLKSDQPEGAEKQISLSNAHGRLAESSVAIGQIFRTFILFEDGDRLVMMDQHTVHERVLFERFMKRHVESSVETQGLLTPETITVSHSLAGVIKGHIPTFSSLGWVAEEFGENTFVVRQIPAVLSGKDFQSAFLEVAETIGANRDADYKDVLGDCVSRIACRAAVKAGDELTLHEIKGLARELSAANLPYTCPHGRPIAMSLTKDELKKYFSR